jgi:hypothetical protein
MKLMQLWNVILDVYQSHDKSFIKRIIPINRASPTPYEQPLMYQSIPAPPPPPPGN